MQNSSVLLVQADEGVSVLVVDRIGDIYRSLPRRADVIVTTVGARHKCQQGSGFEPPMGGSGSPTFNTYKRGFYYQLETVAANVKSSQTSLETSIIYHLTEHQLQLPCDRDFVKLQLAELVNHLKEAGDAKKGEGGQSGRSGEGPSSTRGKCPNYKRGDGSSSYKRSRWF
ncbi:hypothetical protein F511_13238 [Dorcoceras hygrometricum]|uniref:Uncharacterized protein n=1 Tax=Dorcoceras hygrometricum TaxID=472368 RepID=A0A2Z7D1R6_9LAMI|nr:hypothetical protein F511_13238 [Dorcoceras hygrometricum]